MNEKMERSLVVCAAVACLAGVGAQPVTCTVDDHCPTGSYCDPELHLCLACLSCETLKRESPLVSKCVKYVADCGPCLQGLVRASDGSDGCVAAEAAAGLPPYAWAVIGVCLLLFLLFVIGVLVYILRHTETFKILTSATSVETQRSPREIVPATAPPPYNGHFEPVRPSSPPLPNNAEAEAPLVKRAGSGRFEGARESAASQAARVFNNPAYVRGPHLPSQPPSYDEAFSEGSDHEAAFIPPPDEDTMESMWTPADTSEPRDNGAVLPIAAGAASGEPSNSVAGALVRRPSRSDLAPPAKIHCVREDTNNNRGGGGESSGARASSPPRASLVINVLNVNTVHQLNDVSL